MFRFKINEKTKISIASDTLIVFSLYVFTILYNIPITILIPNIIRKPLLLIAIMSFMLGLVKKGSIYLFGFVGLIFFEIVYYSYSWSAKLSFSSYIFPAAVSVEFYVCALLILDKKLKVSSKYLRFYTIVILITTLTTVLGLIHYPTAIRTLGQVADDVNSYWQNYYRSLNMAGWNALFGIAFFCGTLLYMLKMKKEFLIFLTLLSSIVCVVFSQLMFAVLLMMCLLFFVFINDTYKRMIAKMIPFTLLFSILWLGKAKILMWLYGIICNTKMDMLALRVKNLYNLFILKDTDGDAGARFERYSRSINTFVRNPFGRYFSQEKNPLVEIGFHSDFCDILGTVGFLGIIVITIVIITMYRKIKLIKYPYEKRFYIFEVFTLLIMFIINPVISHPHMWLSTLVIPLLAIEKMNGTDKVF
ncbi:hypothetical protein [Pseudobutyrivibrio sp. MD2005]|uniref:hypothetical protein n=1 Tax=Pseudobutyrivibrio sp. MD2005 TaxID=1410616 RepID=UPI00047F64C3|nr:hypothetical protein [Pseudobutyrivibrio sp. MD2005]